MDTSIVIALIALVGSIISSYVSYGASVKSKMLDKLIIANAKLKDEIRARQHEEDTMVKWLVELNAAKSELSAKHILRARTKSEYNVSPSMSPSEVE